MYRLAMASLVLGPTHHLSLKKGDEEASSNSGRCRETWNIWPIFLTLEWLHKPPDVAISLFILVMLRI